MAAIARGSAHSCMRVTPDHRVELGVKILIKEARHAALSRQFMETAHPPRMHRYGIAKWAEGWGRRAMWRTMRDRTHRPR